MKATLTMQDIVYLYYSSDCIHSGSERFQWHLNVKIHEFRRNDLFWSMVRILSCLVFFCFVYTREKLFFSWNGMEMSQIGWKCLLCKEGMKVNEEL